MYSLLLIYILQICFKSFLMKFSRIFDYLFKSTVSFKGCVYNFKIRNFDKKNEDQSTIIEEINNISEEPINNLLKELIPEQSKCEEFKTILAKSILSTHDKEIINTLGRRVITLENGIVTRDEEKGKYIL